MFCGDVTLLQSWVNCMWCTHVIAQRLLRPSPVGLQDVDDPDVEEKPLSSSIHSWDTTHPKHQGGEHIQGLFRVRFMF